MPKPRTDKLCTRIDICVSNELNDAIEKYQAELRLKGTKIRKAEAGEKYFEQLYNEKYGIPV